MKVLDEKYQVIFNTAPVIIMFLDKHGKVLDVNSKMIEKYGYKKKDFLNRSFEELPAIPKSSLSILLNKLDILLNNGRIDPFEFQFLNKKGELIWGLVQVSLIQIRNEINMQAIIQDITNLKLAELKIKESEEKFRNLFKESPNMIILLNDRGIILDFNDRIFDYVSFSKEELIGKDFRMLEFIPKEKIQYLKDLYLKLVQRGYTDSIEFKINRQKDHKLTWITIQASLVKIGEKRFIQVIIQDITEKKKAEIRIQESEEKYRLITENANEVIGVIDDRFNLDFINEKPLQRIFGYTKDEIMGKNTIEYIHPDDIPKTLKKFAKSTKEGSEIQEFRIKHKDGSYVWVESAGKLFIDKQGKKIAITNLREISKRKKIEENLKKTKQRLKDLRTVEETIRNEIEILKQLDQSRKEFLIRLSHELKTPLTLIKGSTDLLSKQYGDLITGRGNNLIGRLKKGEKRLKSLITDIIDYSSIESNLFKINTQTENLTKLIQKCIETVKILSDKRDLIITFNYTDPIMIKIDKYRIEQVILNLLSNAIKNTPPNGVITIQLKQNQDFIELFIRDTGVGFTQNELTKIFKKFGKIERYGKGLNIITEGTGLGLYLSKEIIELHKGKISVQSDGRNKGSIFTIQLPK